MLSVAGNSIVVHVFCGDHLGESLVVWDGDWGTGDLVCPCRSGGVHGFEQRTAHTANATARTALLTRLRTFFLRAHVVPQQSVGCSKLLSVVYHWSERQELFVGADGKRQSLAETWLQRCSDRCELRRGRSASRPLANRQGTFPWQETHGAQTRG